MASCSKKVLEDLERKASQCDYIRFTVADMNGIARGKVVPRRNLLSMAKQGVGIYGGILGIGPNGEITFFQEVKDTNNGNVQLIPEPNTFHLVPFDNSEVITGEVICEPHWYEDGTYQSASPRYVARQQLQRLDDMGLSLKSSCELEFLMFEKDRSTPVFSGRDVFVNSVFASSQRLIYDIEQRLYKAGVDLETLQTEYSGGQFELVMKPMLGIQGADNVFNAKAGIKEICQTNDHFATFITKAGPEVGNGLHFNYSLYNKDDRNILYDPTKKYNLSEFAQHWIGGIIHHARAITVLHASTVNCFRRLGTPWAPTKADWGIQNRFNTLRVKNKDENGTYFENRMSGGLGNPYLIMAANIAAGLDGVKNKMSLPQENNEDAVLLPKTLKEGIKALEDDEVICDALGNQFVRWFKEAKEIGEMTFVDVDIPDTEEALLKEKELYMRLM
ncbi:unnamed protein product [Owenia fusiformis]|uniref:Lengsin n=1 Tax=Owenia fusiformis TaxID=6347 RepID=A0A8J1TJ10_OWEFU|nr:unnamed protein product [Owenia fusiformis]